LTFPTCPSKLLESLLVLRGVPVHAACELRGKLHSLLVRGLRGPARPPVEGEDKAAAARGLELEGGAGAAGGRDAEVCGGDGPRGPGHADDAGDFDTLFRETLLQKQELLEVLAARADGGEVLEPDVAEVEAGEHEREGGSIVLLLFLQKQNLN